MGFAIINAFFHVKKLNCISEGTFISPLILLTFYETTFGFIFSKIGFHN
jgi:hypothetical protein